MNNSTTPKLPLNPTGEDVYRFDLMRVYRGYAIVPLTVNNEFRLTVFNPFGIEQIDYRTSEDLPESTWTEAQRHIDSDLESMKVQNPRLIAVLKQTEALPT